MMNDILQSTQIFFVTDLRTGEGIAHNAANLVYHSAEIIFFEMC